MRVVALTCGGWGCGGAVGRRWGSGRGLKPPPGPLKVASRASAVPCSAQLAAPPPHPIEEAGGGGDGAREGARLGGGRLHHVWFHKAVVLCGVGVRARHLLDGVQDAAGRAGGQCLVAVGGGLCRQADDGDGRVGRQAAHEPLRGISSGKTGGVGCRRRAGRQLERVLQTKAAGCNRPCPAPGPHLAVAVGRRIVGGLGEDGPDGADASGRTHALASHADIAGRASGAAGPAIPHVGLQVCAKRGAAAGGGAGAGGAAAAGAVGLAVGHALRSAGGQTQRGVTCRGMQRALQKARPLLRHACGLQAPWCCSRACGWAAPAPRRWHR